MQLPSLEPPGRACAESLAEQDTPAFASASWILTEALQSRAYLRSRVFLGEGVICPQDVELPHCSLLWGRAPCQKLF